MSCCQNKSANWICGNTILSTVVCGTYFAGSDTILILKFFRGIFGGGTRLAMPKTILHARLIVIEAGLGATVGVLDQGVSGQLDYLHWPDCQTMKIQDRRLRLVSGQDSTWRGRQARQYIYGYLLLCNRPCVNLTLSGVYIQQRVLVCSTTITTYNHTVGQLLGFSLSDLVVDLLS